MELAKNIFFFIGSVMGILAFFKPLLEPLLEKNKQRWEKLQQGVTENDFANIEHQTWNSRYIKDTNLDRVEKLMYDIENKTEYLRFGPFLKKYYESEINELLRLYLCFRELVQVPEWEPVGHLEDSEREPLVRRRLIKVKDMERTMLTTFMSHRGMRRECEIHIGGYLY